ncbi:hypothetical protein V8F06_007725 [Rhypophila decipiens]
MPRKRSNPDAEACASTPRKSARLTHRHNFAGNSTELTDKLNSLKEFWEEETEWAAKEARKDYLLQMPKKTHKYVNKNGVRMYDDRYVQVAKKQVDYESSDVDYKYITPPPRGLYIPLAGIPKTAPTFPKYIHTSGIPKFPPGKPLHLYQEDPEDQQMEEAVPARDIPRPTVEATFDGVSDYFVGTSAANVAELPLETLQKAAKMPSRVVTKKSPKRSPKESSPTPRKTSKSPAEKTVKSPERQTLQKTIRKTSPKTTGKDVKKTVQKAVEKLSVENAEPVVAAPQKLRIFVRKSLMIYIRRSNDNQLTASLAPAHQRA